MIAHILTEQQQAMNQRLLSKIAVTDQDLFDYKDFPEGQTYYVIGESMDEYERTYIVDECVVKRSNFTVSGKWCIELKTKELLTSLVTKESPDRSKIRHVLFHRNKDARAVLKIVNKLLFNGVLLHSEYAQAISEYLKQIKE